MCGEVSKGLFKECVFSYNPNNIINKYPTWDKFSQQQSLIKFQVCVFNNLLHYFFFLRSHKNK